EGAARFEIAAPLFERFVATLQASGVRVQSGVFRASMQVALVNDGPATFVWRTGKKTG
ncbi:MAG TPA: D-aminoacyl-tRNA deacylase, partial [Thermoanaerobaculia bacterium]|nr:D-aminoacyl-tRNA deacylase [Thermoanaerobaculia bacterium]